MKEIGKNYLASLSQFILQVRKLSLPHKNGFLESTTAQLGLGLRSASPSSVSLCYTNYIRLSKSLNTHLPSPSTALSPRSMLTLQLSIQIFLTVHTAFHCCIKYFLKAYTNQLMGNCRTECFRDASGIYLVIDALRSMSCILLKWTNDDKLLLKWHILPWEHSCRRYVKYERITSFCLLIYLVVFFFKQSVAIAFSHQTLTYRFY